MSYVLRVWSRGRDITTGWTAIGEWREPHTAQWAGYVWYRWADWCKRFICFSSRYSSSRCSSSTWSRLAKPNYVEDVQIICWCKKDHPKYFYLNKKMFFLLKYIYNYILLLSQSFFGVKMLLSVYMINLEYFSHHITNMI